ncbi:MAG: GDSL-type esterase/lipase family protein [Rhodospirillales bacterium]
MTLATTPRVTTPVIATGAAQTVPFTFRVFSDAEIEVLFRDPATDVVTVVPNTGYTITRNPDQNTSPGGSVRTTATAGQEIYLRGATSAAQPATLANQGALWPQVAEEIVDRLAAVVQELNERVSRAPLLPIGSSIDGEAFRAALLQAAQALNSNNALVSDLVVGTPHYVEHQRLKQQIVDLQAAVAALTPAPGSPTPTPTPPPAPAPSGDTFDVSTAIPSPMTLERAGAAHYVSGISTVASASTDVGRYDKAPATGTALGLLLEAAMTNKLEYGEAPGGTGWTAIGGGVTRTTGRTDPKGGTNAVRLQASAGANGIQGQVLGLSGSQAARAWLKSNKGVAQNLRVRDMATNEWVQVTAGTGWQPLTSSGTGTSFFNFTIVASDSETLDVDVWCAAVVETNSTDPSDIPNSGSGTTTKATDRIEIASGLTNGTRDIQIIGRYGAADPTLREFWIRNATVSGNAHAFNASDIEGFPGSLRVTSITYFAAGTAPAPTPTPPPAPTPTPAPTPGPVAPGALGDWAALGDSQTRGWLANPGGAIYAPGDYVKSGLAAVGYTLDYVGIYSGVMEPGGHDVTATGGWTIADLAAQIPAVGALNPDYVSVNIGTNDLASGTARPGIGNDMVALLNSIETECGAIPIFVFAPVNPGWFNSGNHTILKAAMQNWCSQANNRFYRDLSTIGMAGADFNGDGTHYSMAGAQKVAAAMVETIRGYLVTGSGSQAPTPAPASTIYSSQMNSLNEGLPIFFMSKGRAGFDDGSFKYCGGFVYKMNEPGTTGTLILRPWFIGMPEDDGSGNYNYAAAPNSLLELSWFRTYRKPSGAGWGKIYERQDCGNWFNWYDKNQGAQGGTELAEGQRYKTNKAYVASNGKLYIPLNAFIEGNHVMFHGGSGDTFEFVVGSGTGLSQQLQARIVKANASGPDDRANIPIVMNIGCDRTNGKLDEYMHGSMLKIPSDGSYKLLTNINMTTNKACTGCGLLGKNCNSWPGELSQAQVDADPPPIPVFGS